MHNERRVAGQRQRLGWPRGRTSYDPLMSDLWAPKREESRRAAEPLAVRMRPRTLEEFVGQRHILGPGKLLRRMLNADAITSLILHGPPGTGKTTLAEVIARHTKRHFERENAASVGVKRIQPPSYVLKPAATGGIRMRSSPTRGASAGGNSCGAASARGGSTSPRRGPLNSVCPVRTGSPGTAGSAARDEPPEKSSARRSRSP